MITDDYCTITAGHNIFLNRSEQIMDNKYNNKEHEKWIRKICREEIAKHMKQEGELLLHIAGLNKVRAGNKNDRPSVPK